MLDQVRMSLAPSVSEMIVATGNVFTRKNAVHEAIRGKDPDQVWPAREFLCHSSAHVPDASPIVFTLKRSFTGLRFPPRLGNVWIADETSATSMPSKRLSCAAAIKIKGRFTDMLPLTPGSFSFSREAIADTARKMR